MKLSVFGLGKLGLCTACCFASAGNSVVGVDVNEAHIAELKNGRVPIQETGLEELYCKAKANFTPTMSVAEAIENSDLSLIIVPTPSLEHGGFTNEYVEKALESMAPHIKAKDSFHIVDVVSTVMPGSCDKVFKPLLEKLTGKVCGEGFGLVYNPEFIALGSVIANFLNPDMVLIGASDERSGEILRKLYASMVLSQPNYSVMSLVNAEITKLSLNCFVTMKISFANELAAVCERVPGADVDVVTSAVGADSRVGKKCLKGGLGFGGPCFPRDNKAFQRFAETEQLSIHLSPSVVAVNNALVDRLETAITSQVSPGSGVALLGLSYKTGTHIVEESHSIMLAEKLIAKGYQVRLHDPLALPHLPEELAGKSSLHEDPYEATKGVRCVALLTDWPQFDLLDWDRIAQGAAENPVLIDSWRTLKDSRPSQFMYTAIGLGS
jgi:UDPglucose 6-dehydrogenase